MSNAARHPDQLSFQPMEIKWQAPELVFNPPGISMAFFRGRSSQVDWRKVVSPVKLSGRRKPSERVIRAFLDAALQNAPFDGTVPRSELNERLINVVYDAGVITEELPPKSNPFSKLLGSASIITIGAAVGVAAFTGNPIMIVAVPTGIFAVGASAVILEWLRRGGNHIIDRALKFQERRPARKRRKRS